MWIAIKRIDEYKIYTLKFNLRFMHLKALKGEMNPLEWCPEEGSLFQNRIFSCRKYLHEKNLPCETHKSSVLRLFVHSDSGNNCFLTIVLSAAASSPS